MRYLIPVAGFAICAIAPAAEVTVVDEIVAKVNGDIITKNELARDRATLDAEAKKQNVAGKELQDAISNLLRNKVDNLLLQQKGKDLDIKVDTEVNKQIADIQRQVNIADPSKFEELVQKETGKSYADYKTDLKNQALVSAVVREEVLRKIQFTNDELHAYYDSHLNDFQRKERVFLREIVVDTRGKENDPVAMAAAEKKAKDLAVRAHNEKFTELAQTSSDSVTAPEGGALPAFTKGELAKQLEDAVWTKEKGYITDPIKMPTGYVILRVDEHYKEGLASFEEVEPQIQDMIIKSRQEVALRAYLTKLRENAYLEIKAGYTDTGAAPGKSTAWTDPAVLRPETTTKEEVVQRIGNKKVLGLIPIPGTKQSGSSSSR